MPAVGKVLAALDFLQRQRKLAHGNVKGSNVLLSSNGEVKLSDLSSCKNLREEFKQSSLSIVSSRGNPSDKRFRQAVPRRCFARARLAAISAPSSSRALLPTRFPPLTRPRC